MPVFSTENGIDGPHSVENGVDETSIEDQFFEQISEPPEDELSLTRMKASTIREDLLPIIHMDCYTPEERSHFEDVVRRSIEINEAEIIRQQELRTELDSVITTNHDEAGEDTNSCHCCGEPFSFIFNPKKQCEQCSLLVCGKCITVFRKGVTKLCRLCYVEDIHEGRSGKWFMVTLQKTGRNANFGCDILRASLRRQAEEDEKERQRRLREEQAERERLAAEAAAAEAAVAAALAAETSARSPRKGSAKSDRLSVTGSIDNGGLKDGKKWKFGKKGKRGHEIEDIAESTEDLTISLNPSSDEYNDDVHEERSVDVDDNILQLSHSSLHAEVDPAARSGRIPTIKVEADSEDERWRDHKYDNDENRIFPDSGPEDDDPGLRTPRSAISHESITSIYSDTSASYRLAVDVTGEVLVGLDYDFKHRFFFVRIKQCRDIAAVDTKKKKSDPYVKVYLLPDKTKVSKRKTSYRKATLNPVFDEQVKYVISKSELETRVLSVSVWHRVALGHNIFLGETLIHLDDYDFEDSVPKWYGLHEKKDIAIPMPLMMYKGDLILAIKYVPGADLMNVAAAGGTELKGEVHVWVKEAKNLGAAMSNGYSNPFCKGYLMPDRSKNGKKKTRVIRRNLNPAWNTVMRFVDVEEATLSERSLELTIWDYGRFRTNEFLGGLRLNLGLGVHYGQHVRWMDARGHEVTMWQAMMSRTNTWIEGTLMLRPNID